MLSAIPRFLAQKLKELYWDVTRAIGMEWIHGASLEEITGECQKMYSSCLRRIDGWRKHVIRGLYAPAAWALRRIDVHFINAPCLQLERIGHFAVDIDCYLKERILKGKRFRPVLLCPPGCNPNQALLSHWSRHVYVIKSSMIQRLLKPLLEFPGLSTRMNHLGMVGWQAWDKRFPFEARRGASPIFRIEDQWGDRAPLLRLSDAELARGNAELRALGLPEGAWFVCVHAREGGYSPTDEWSHSHRNTNVSDYHEAMKAIVARGGWCVRVGDSTMRPLEAMEGVIDYARSSSKSDWMDIFLCASCKFFLGTSSGLFLVADIFGKRSAIVGTTPFAGAYSPFPGDLAIPKLLRDMQGRLLTWAEIAESEAAELKLSPEFVERGLVNVDNSPAEIAELAIEMMDTLDNRMIEDSEDADLQARFRALVKPYHYCWHATGRIGRAFLRRHKALL